MRGHAAARIYHAAFQQMSPATLLFIILARLLRYLRYKIKDEMEKLSDGTKQATVALRSRARPEVGSFARACLSRVAARASCSRTLSNA